MKKKIALGAAYFAPFIAFAAGPNFIGVLQTIKDIFDVLIPFLITLAVLYFIYGVVRYILTQNDETAQKEARNIMINGVIALFVIVSVWGLVNVLITTFGLETSIPPSPAVPSL